MTPEAGLTEQQVVAARSRGEGNSVGATPSRSYLLIVRTNLFNFFNNLLFAIGVGLLALGRVNDAILSVGLGLVNALISSIQELRAKRKLDSLRLLNSARSRVLRDGVEREVPAEDLVRGDLVRLVSGDQVVVDGPVVSGRLEVDESLLTGESESVLKGGGDRLLSGSFCLSGEGLQRAESVGADSYAQSVTAAAREWTSSRTPLQQQVDLVVRIVMLIVASISAVILLQAALEGLPLVRVVQISAVLSGLVPYGLFFLITLSYAVGAATIAKRGAIVQQINAVESLSNVDVVCMDKTGTLTSGALILEHVLPVDGDAADGSRALLGSFARTVGVPNATMAAVSDGLDGTPLRVREEVAFSSARRWSAVAFDDAAIDGVGPGGVCVLGALEALTAALRPGGRVAGRPLAEAAGGFADEGLRVLLFATSVHKQARLHDATGAPGLPELAPRTLVVLSDELRPQVQQALAELAERGVAVKVISGDDPRTVSALAARVGVAESAAVSGADLAAMPAAQFAEAVNQSSVFGRIAPKQKEAIIEALRVQGRYVAMIGDGVNDVRSLKRAHVGIAMQSGASVTRDVADLVLLQDSFAALSPAQTQGQKIIGGISTSMNLFLARVLTSILIIVAVGILGLGFPYEPAQVAVTLFTVGVPTLFLTMWARPQRPDPNLPGTLARFVIPAALVTAGFAVGIYALVYRLVVDELLNQKIPQEVVQKFESFTGVSGSQATFTDAAASIAAQTAMSSFTALAAFTLILFLEPPSRLFTGWAPVSADKRPAILAAALFVTLLVIVVTPPLARYFTFVVPPPVGFSLVMASTLLWFFALRAVWRHRFIERFLGVERTA